METKDTLSSCSNSEEQQMQQIQDKAKESCMVSFRKLHSHLKHLSHDNLKGTRIESGFKRAFATLFDSDQQRNKVDTGKVEDAILVTQKALGQNPKSRIQQQIRE
ncbi:hypothetical protein Tco_0356653 [Tanacetum coccineum]